MDLLTTKQAAIFLKCSPRTLQRWRQYRQGPPYIHQEGRIFYVKTDLERWQYQNRTLYPPKPRGRTCAPFFTL
jgi:hypothetical protein